MTAVTEATSKTTVPFSTETLASATPAVSREAAAVERSLIDASTSGPVLTFFATAVLWLLVSTGFHLLTSIQLVWPNFLWLSSVPFLSYGRLYPAYQNAFIFGWCSLVGMGVATWLMARLCRVSIRAPGVLVFGALFWNLGLLAGIIFILAGAGRPLEGMEIPATCQWLMFAGYTLIGLWGAVMYRFRREAVAFISVWYLLGALFWFPWVMATANVVLGLPEVRGVMQSIVAAWFAQNVAGWWLTALGLAAAYFFIPKVINRPIHSYSLASLGFWTFAFLSGLTGMVRLSGAPIPVWLVTVSITASIMMIVPISTVTANLVMTMRGHTNMVYHSPTIRFTYFGALAFAVAGVLGILGSLRSLDAIVHFTQFQSAHQSILLYSFYSMVMFGAMYYITPRIVGCEWLSSTMISLHFWGAAYGGAGVGAVLICAGLAQGLSLADPAATFPQIIEIAAVYFPGRVIALLLVAAAHVIFALHFLLMLLRIGQPGGEPTLFAPLDEEKH
jgi:cytochrome c oxidase cbb3-type subunit I